MFANSVRARAAVAVLAAVALLIAVSASAASASEQGSSPPSTTKSGGKSAGVLGPVDRASGAPIRIGYINDGQSAGVDARPELTVAQAAVKYANEHLGGIAGRPIELVTCETNLTPAGGTDCANQMIAAKVPVVLSAAPSQPAAVVKGLEEAQIPYFTYAAIDQNQLLSPDAYVLTNPLGTLAAHIKVAKDNRVKKVSMVLIDVPAAVGPIQGVATPMFGSAGISVSFTAIAPGTPDMTPQIQGALSKGAQQFSIVGDPAFCISALSALKTLGFKGKTIINSQCLSRQVAKSVPGGINGTLVSTNESLDPKDPEVALYEAVVAKYASKTPPHEANNSGGYASVVGLVRALKGLSLTGDLTPDAVRTQLASMPPSPLPLLSKQTFKCDRTAVSLTPAVCSTAVVVLKLGASGKVTRANAFDPTPYVKLG
jgi:branched-chain amino acid transport system substrate-binding protein